MAIGGNGSVERSTSAPVIPLFTDQNGQVVPLNPEAISLLNSAGPNVPTFTVDFNQLNQQQVTALQNVITAQATQGNQLAAHTGLNNTTPVSSTNSAQGTALNSPAISQLMYSDVARLIDRDLEDRIDRLKEAEINSGWADKLGNAARNLFGFGDGSEKTKLGLDELRDNVRQLRSLANSADAGNIADIGEFCSLYRTITGNDLAEEVAQGGFSDIQGTSSLAAADRLLGNFEKAQREWGTNIGYAGAVTIGVGAAALAPVTGGGSLVVAGGVLAGGAANVGLQWSNTNGRDQSDEANQYSFSRGIRDFAGGSIGTLATIAIPGVGGGITRAMTARGLAAAGAGGRTITTAAANQIAARANIAGQAVVGGGLSGAHTVGTGLSNGDDFGTIFRNTAINTGIGIVAGPIAGRIPGVRTIHPRLVNFSESKLAIGAGATNRTIRDAVIATGGTATVGLLALPERKPEGDGQKPTDDAYQDKAKIKADEAKAKKPAHKRNVP